MAHALILALWRQRQVEQDSQGYVETRSQTNKYTGKNAILTKTNKMGDYSTPFCALFIRQQWTLVWEVVRVTRGAELKVQKQPHPAHFPIAMSVPQLRHLFSKTSALKNTATGVWHLLLLIPAITTKSNVYKRVKGKAWARSGGNVGRGRYMRPRASEASLANRAPRVSQASKAPGSLTQ